MLKSTLPILLTIAAASCGIETELFNTEESSNLNSEAMNLSASRKEVSASKDMKDDIVKVLGAHFQSCAPILNPSKDVRDILDDYFNEKESYSTDSCKDRRKDDLRYISFGTGSIKPNAGLLQESGGRVDALERFNCSGFVAATMTAGGLKYYKGQIDKFFSPRTHEIADIFKKSDSCFFKPKLSKNASLLPGDIINVGHSHAIRILTVGKDPLGLNQVKDKSDCKDISKKDLDFTFAHSTSRDKSDGVSGVRVEEARKSGISLIGKLVDSVRDMCKDKFKGGKIKGKLKDKKVGEKSFGPFIKKDQIFSLRRHFGKSKDSCSYSAPKVKGEECIDSACYEKVN